jgi:MFS transporter, OFA family, oxalate/formate antiporter
LGDVCNVRHGRRGRADGDGAARTDRQGLQCWRNPGINSWDYAAGTNLRALDRPRAQRLLSPVLRWVSDNIGRENTMFIAFLAEGIGIWLLYLNASDPLLFVLLSGVVFFAWGEIYSLFPATCTDIYGRTFATTNYGLLYTAKGTASLLVPLANVLQVATGSWKVVFLVAAALNIVAAVMALVLLKPLRIKTMSKG